MEDASEGPRRCDCSAALQGIVMNKVERLFVYGGISLAVALGLGWRGVGEAAHAQGGGSTPGAAKIGVLDTLMIVERLVDSDRYKPAREAFQKDAADKLTKSQAEFGELEAKFRSLPDDSPEKQGIVEKAQAIRGEDEKTRNSVEKFNTDQIAEAYRVVIEAAGKIADARGYTHLVGSRTDTQLVRSPNVQGAVQEMLARPMLKMPAGDDLTTDVMKELKVEAKAVEAPAPAPAPAAAPTEAPKK